MDFKDRDLPQLVYAYGFSARKRPIVRRFLGGRRVHFVRQGSRVPPGGTLLLWGSSPAPAGLARDVRLVRVEDGFLRSVGLGAELVQPLSWVMDDLGIYYDATRPSALEHILQTTEFSPGLIERAARLRSRIVEKELTKYNVGALGWVRPAGIRRVVLVPGQVETDASIRFGAPGISTNIGLLKVVREANPDAYLIYKPHPDVMAGLRARGQGEEDARYWCDEIISDVSMGRLLSAVDELHVLTSLAGFEALLRGKRVVCHGQPFYAGWGLTDDTAHIPRRTRRLKLDELVAGALILYPTYISRTGLPSSPERALEELMASKNPCSSGVSLRRQALRFTLRLVVGRA